MKKIGVMSDTHGFLPEQVFDFFKDVDLILHAGDIGSHEVLDRLRAFKQIVAVYGNCDDKYLDEQVKAMAEIEVEQVKILLTHIGGYPKHYNKNVVPCLAEYKPDIFVCGHSHILKVVYDREFNLLSVNPGACGRQGFHTVSTLLRFQVDGKKIENMEVLNFDKF